MFEVQPPPKARLRQAVIFFGLYAVVGGFVTLCAWVTGIDRLADWGASGISMKANAAIASIFCGASLIQFAKAPGRTLALRTLATVVVLLGGLTLFEHLTLIDLRIDTLLFYEAPGARATSSPGRMGIPASTSFLLLGLALFSLAGRLEKQKWSVRLGLVALTIATLSLTGHLYGADVMFSIPKFTGIASQTASIILAISLGVILCVPDRDPVRMALESGATGILVRYAIPIVIILPFGLGWLRLWIQEEGWVDTAFGTALRTVTEVGLLVFFLWWAARSMRRHERALFESREVLRTTLRSIGDGVITTDPKGSVTYLNPVAETFTGWQDFEAKGQPLDNIFTLIDEATRRPSRRSPDPMPPLEPALNAPDQLLISRHGTEHPIDATSAPILDGDGNALGSVLVFRDATRRRASERDLRARALELEQRVTERTVELRNSHEQLESFVYSIAHDLRAPLRTMASFSQLLTEECSRQLDDTGKDFLRRIREGAEFMDRLLLDLLAYGKTSQAEMELEDVELEETVATALNQLGGEVVQTGALIEIHDPLPKVRAHEATLVQCVTNLLSNSMKFVAPGVRPRIDIFLENGIEPAIDVPPSEGNGNVRVVFCDNGIGIAPEHQERVFRVFERLQGNRYSGTGIGLSIVRKGIQRMGGCVGISSAVGEGCRFWIQLRKAD